MSGTRHIYVRVALAVVADGRILLVPSFNTDAGPVQWVLPGGQVEFGERLADAAAREFAEETRLEAKVGALLHVSEVVRPERPWHSVIVTFVGTATGGVLPAEHAPAIRRETAAPSQADHRPSAGCRQAPRARVGRAAVRFQPAAGCAPRGANPAAGQARRDSAQPVSGQ